MPIDRSLLLNYLSDSWSTNKWFKPVVKVGENWIGVDEGEEGELHEVLVYVLQNC